MKGKLLYEGKAKQVYECTENPDWVILDFKDSLTAFNAQKKGSFEGKGKINREISTLIFEFLKKNSIPSHWVRNLNEDSMLVQKVSIIPLEVVVRNYLAGSLAKKMGKTEGQKLSQPLVEFYFKDDSLNDPFLSDDQIKVLGIADDFTLIELKKRALKINDSLIPLFDQVGVLLIDMKFEFGRTKSGEIVLADEITPDCCRLWDRDTKEKLDKDRFRRDLGNIKQSYEEILLRLKGALHG